jgi:type IV pilus assembly protein PilV
MKLQPKYRLGRGGLMLEVLVAMLLCAFSLMGFAGLQAHATGMEFEALQRSQALVLLDDMVSRLTLNRTGAVDYVTTGLIGDGPLQDCNTTGTVAAHDVCEWGNLLRGSSETQGGNRVGAILSARGCIELGFGSSDRYVVTVVWSGIRPTSGPNSLCGLANATYPDDTLRRVVSATVCIARLRDPSAPTSTPRC